MDKTGIVILNYGTPKDTCRLIKKIYKYEYLDKVVVVDNNSGDNSSAIINDYISLLNSEKIIFIKSKINGGYAKGNNLGLRYLVDTEKCDICFISNPDISFKEEDFNNILYCFGKYKDYGVLTCRRVVSDGTPLRQFWKLPTYGDILLEKFFFVRIVRRKKEVYKVSKEREIVDTQVAPGAFWAVRTDLLKKVNFLDENTFLFYEENCFARRIESLNTKIGLVTSSEYCVLAGKASTNEMKRNGKMMGYLLKSQRHYLKEYLNTNGIKLFIYDVLCKYNYLEMTISGIRKK